MNQLHPGAKWNFRIGGYISLLFFGFFFGMWLLVPLSITGISGVTIFSLIIAYIILAIVITEIYAKMAYNRWFYEFTKDGLKLERGIIWKRYSNVPYGRIQNIDIHRGIIARILGFSTISIQTAGYSHPTRGHAEGYIPAVGIKEAEKIREFVMKRIKGNRQGL